MTKQSPSQRSPTIPKNGQSKDKKKDKDKGEKVDKGDKGKQTSLPWAKPTGTTTQSVPKEDLSKCRAISVSKKLLYKACASREFMLLKTTNVRAVAPGQKVYVVAESDIDGDTDSKAQSKVCAVVGVCHFQGNHKMTLSEASDQFALHLSNTSDVKKFMADKETDYVIGWRFDHFELLETISWVVGVPRKDLGFRVEMFHLAESKSITKLVLSLYLYLYICQCFKFYDILY